MRESCYTDEELSLMRRSLRTSRFRLLTASAATFLLIGAFASCDVTPSSSASASGAKLDQSKLDQETKLAIVDQYIEATHTQQEVLRGAQMEVEIEAKLPALEKHGKLRALRKISRLGRITYKALGFSGDNTVKQEVISRYLAAESEARDLGTIAITPANYRFHYAGRLTQGDETVQILDVTPRKNIVGLFKGELWVDAKTGMPVRESGQFVKNPSVFLKKIAFVRYYEMHDGVAYPSRIESTVDTRIVGRAELEIYFKNFTRPEAAEDDDADATSVSGGASRFNINQPNVNQTGVSQAGSSE